MKLFRITLLLLILKTQFVFGQENLLVNFTGQQIETYIHLNFTVIAGISCLGTEVQRSPDGIQFETIGIIPGICGGTEEQDYFFDDSLPLKNQLNYYRIDLKQYGTSNSINLKFIDYGDGFVIAPNPATEIISVFFSNFNNQKITFTIFSLNGITLQSITTNSSTVSLNRNQLPLGIYFFQIRNTEQILQTEKIVLQ
ncbi:MAG: T9SS type A sorting domain-containing protein [Chitinophagales bacterium]|nr:T9SS type A sorting domain-containing protein [Chitinophagales bacterium]